jgi:hypothetical protein
MTLTNYFVDWLAPHTNGKASVATYPLIASYKAMIDHIIADCSVMK